ncbi:class I SAM-dependent methyltransferase [Candidatus Woesearchaeota archaeon]|nr:MAG: class I SAM-dependent methyltransferase [Candidatus Woesearchaeota archaeon]
MKGHREADNEMYYRAISLFSSKKKVKILELGCAGEESIKKIRMLFPHAEIHGVEYEGWRGKFEKFPELESLHFLDLNKDDFPFEHESFDFIFCNQVLEHIYEIDAALEKIYSILKKNGYFICGTPNLAAVHERISLLFGFNPSTWHTANIQLGLRYPASTNHRTHCNGFTITGLKRLLKYHRFKPQKYLVSEVYLGKNFYIPFFSKLFKGFALSQCWISQK